MYFTRSVGNCIIEVNSSAYQGKCCCPCASHADVHISVNHRISRWLVVLRVCLDPSENIFLFFTITNKCTINLQIIILLLHVSTLLCHPQGASQYLASYTSITIQLLVMEYKISHIFYAVEISTFKIFKTLKLAYYSLRAKIILL
jgi:hypothetical protein